MPHDTATTIRHLLAVPRFPLNTCGRRAFSVAGLMAWNSLAEFIYPGSNVLTAHLSVGANSAPLGLPAGFWGRESREKGGERKRKEKETGRGKGRKREEGKEKGIKERRGEKKGKKRKGRREGEGRNFVQL